MKDFSRTAHFHLPGLFEFYELYKVFLPLYREHREYFYEWCDIASIYGAPEDCLWGGGRAAVVDCEAGAGDVLALMKEYGISARLTFSNSLLREEHLKDRKCNRLCEMFARGSGATAAVGEPNSAVGEQISRDDELNPAARKINSPAGELNSLARDNPPANGIIVYSELLTKYLRRNFPELYLVSSTTKVITDFQKFTEELLRPEFSFVVPDFRLNKEFSKLSQLEPQAKNKVEFLCNECCSVECMARAACYENVSRKNLGLETAEHECKAPGGNGGYRFSLAMKNPAFISVNDILKTYLPMGFSNFKIEGRGLGSAIVLEFLLYYMTKPEFQLHVREAVYLDSMLDLF